MCVSFYVVQPRSAGAPPRPHGAASTRWLVAGRLVHARVRHRATPRAWTAYVDGRAPRRSSRATCRRRTRGSCARRASRSCATSSSTFEEPEGPTSVPVDAASSRSTHYRELLEAAKAGGYRFAGFDRRREPGDLILRHDVDLSLEAAVAMAEVEAEPGAWSTWFLMTRLGLLQPRLGRRARAAAAARARRTRSPTTRSGRTSTSTSASTRSSPGTTPTPSTCRADRRRRERDGAAVVRPGPLPLRLEPRTGATAARTTQLARGEFEWLQLLNPPRDLGLRRRDDGRDDASRSSTPTAPPASSTCAPTGSTCREADHRRRHRLGRARHRGAPARAARERRARGAARRHRHERALGRPAPLRRVPPRARRLGPGLPRRGAARSPSARAPAAILPQSSFDLEGLAGARERFGAIAGARLVARRDPPLERQGRDLRVPAPARPAGARLPAGRAARARSRRRRASSATRSGRSASSRCSRRARAASGSSTRPSTAPTSSCASGPARCRCGSRTRSRSSPRSTDGPSCS